jgi:hypothetical protein
MIDLDKLKEFLKQDPTNDKLNIASKKKIGVNPILH